MIRCNYSKNVKWWWTRNLKQRKHTYLFKFCPVDLKQTYCYCMGSPEPLCRANYSAGLVPPHDAPFAGPSASEKVSCSCHESPSENQKKAAFAASHSPSLLGESRVILSSDFAWGQGVGRSLVLLSVFKV